MKMVHITINQSSSTEIARFLSDNSRAFNPPFSSSVDVDAYAQKLTRHATMVELRAEHGLVGILAAYINTQTKVAYVPYICVASDMAGQGCGKALLNELYQHCGECDYVELEVRIENQSAIRFYTNNGFRIVEDRGEKYYMRKNILCNNL